MAALIIGFLGVRARDRNSIIGVAMPFGLDLAEARGVPVARLTAAVEHGKAAVAAKTALRERPGP